MARRISKEEAAAVVMEDIAAGRYKKWPEQCPHCQEPLPLDLMGYKVAHALGAAEAASLCTQYAAMLPAEATEAGPPAHAPAAAILANAGCLPGDDIKVEQAGPETRSWVQALTAKWPAGDPGEGHSGFCQHHLTGECAPGCHRREGGRVMSRLCIILWAQPGWTPGGVISEALRVARALNVVIAINAENGMLLWSVAPEDDEWDEVKGFMADLDLRERRREVDRKMRAHLGGLPDAKEGG